ncbi:MAG: sigma-70 family RNA polymerase sigma factor [Verrucomicrobia bacterium]|nr:sigma-70 family RNA polymerase sigma factor [Verrucomicrobiota bacterium]MCH8512283.1 sigma-70 family RNA polymerase sigma factor [Kiritimatiellia bacterium]
MSDVEKTEEEIPEKVLVQRAREGDVEAFEVLMRRYHGRIYALLYNMTSNKEDAEDLLQEVFLKAYQALPKFKGQSSFYTWVYRIGVNRAINYVKKRKRRTALSLDNVDLGIERDPALVEMASGDSPHRQANLKELQEKLNNALQTLSEKHRIVVVMHDIEGVPHNEIAEYVGCSPGTVRSRLFYARQQLQAELADLLKND